MQHKVETIELDANVPVVFFDGVCNLCNASVQFIIRQDAAARFRFAPLQGETAKAVLPANGVNPAKPQSIILKYQGKVFAQSSAVLKIAVLMGGWWKLSALGYVFPAFLRNWVYDGIARYRYRWFGQQAACMIPTPALRARFMA